MSQTMKRILVTSIVLVLCSALFLYFYDFPKTIQKVYPAIQYVEGDESSMRQTTITVDGTLRHPLFRDQRFDGSIVIDGYEFTKSYELIEVQFYQNVRNGLGSLVYYTAQEGSHDMQSLGFIWKTGDFDRIKIMAVGDEDESLITDTIIAPADNYDTALSIEKLFKD